MPDGKSGDSRIAVGNEIICIAFAKLERDGVAGNFAKSDLTRSMLRALDLGCHIWRSSWNFTNTI